MRKKHLVKKQVLKLITSQMNLILLLQFHVKPEEKKRPSENVPFKVPASKTPKLRGCKSQMDESPSVVQVA